MTIELQDVSKWYGTICALRNVTLSVGPAESIVVYGENGAGKTTLLQCIAGIVRPSSGKIVRSIPVSRFGVVLSQSMLYGDLTVSENLELTAALYRLRAKKRAAQEMLSVCDLENVKDRRVRECSYGVTKRISIARALIHRPQILLFDEPFSGLDESSEEKIIQLLHRHRQEGGSSIVITHDRRIGDSVGTRFLALREGLLV